MSQKNINRLYVGVEGELNFLLFTRDSVIACLCQCQMTGSKFVFGPFLFSVVLTKNS